VDREGIYADEGLMKTWPESGPEVVWETDIIGNGYGSPVFTGDMMYIMGEVDTMAILFAFDLDGDLVWKSDYGKEWVKNYNGSRCAPTIVDDQVFAVSGLGNLYCFDRHTGETLWSVDMVNDLEGEFPLFGYSEAIEVEDGLVFCMPGGTKNNVVALDRLTGDVVWSCKGLGERPGYNQPRIIELEERNVLVHFSAYAAIGLDTQTGELLWSHNQDNTTPEERKPGLGDTHSNTVLYDDGYIYYSAGDGNCGVKLELAPDGSSIKEVWRNADFDGYMGGIVKIGDWLYGCGSAKPGLKSINTSTGELGSVMKSAPGNVISADGMLYYYNFRGEVILVDMDPENLQEISKFRMKKGKKEHFAHPVINDGKLYVRHGNVLQAYDITNRDS